MKYLPNMISRRGIIQSAGLVSAAAALGTMPAFVPPPRAAGHAPWP